MNYRGNRALTTTFDIFKKSTLKKITVMMFIFDVKIRNNYTAMIYMTP